MTLYVLKMDVTQRILGWQHVSDNCTNQRDQERFPIQSGRSKIISFDRVLTEFSRLHGNTVTRLPGIDKWWMVTQLLLYGVLSYLLV